MPSERAPIFIRPSEKTAFAMDLSSPLRIVRAAFQTTTLVGLVALVTANLAVSAYLADRKQKTLEYARTNARNLNTAFDQFVGSAVRNIDQSLLIARAEITRGPAGLSLETRGQRDYFPNDFAIELNFIGIDGMGRPSNPQAERIDPNHQDHIRIHRERNGDELFISRPILGPDQRWTIQFTRGVRDKDGAIAGILMATVPADRLTRIYDSIDIGQNGALTVWGRDGIILARAGVNPETIGRAVPNPAFEKAVQGAHEGIIELTSVIDGVRRIVSFRVLNDYPLITTLAISRDEILRDVAFNEIKLRRLMVFVNFVLLAIIGLGTIEKYRLNAARERLAAQTDMLEEARDRAEAASRTRTAFLATMSHEIRTPLGSVLSMIDLIGATNLDRRQARYISVTRESAEHLLQLIDDVLDVTKLDADQVRLESIPYDVQRQIRSVLDIVTVKAQEKNLSIGCLMDPDVPRQIIGDPGRLRQVLLNLLGNAIKFTPNGHVLLEVSCRKEAGENRLSFRVEDTGIGIAPENIDHLFRDFSQIDSSISRRFGGTGLGLSISQKLVQRMGGRIEVESKAGIGSAFFFSLPLDCAGTPPMLQREKASIAIISASAFDRDVIRRQIAPGYAAVDSFASVDAALDWFKTCNKDWRQIALLDPSLADQLVSGAGEIEIFLLATKQEWLASDNSGAPSFAGIVQKPVFLETMRKEIALDNTDMAAIQQPLSGRLSGMRILLADDHATNLFALRCMLEGMGAQVLSVTNGKAAVERVQQSHIDLVLMDVMMPDMDGLAATRAIRALASPVREIPIIALTASAFVEDRTAAFEAGVNGFATKPVTALGLMEAIQSCKIQPRTDTGPTSSLDERVLAQLRRDLGEAHIGTALDLFKKDVTHRCDRLRKALGEPATMRQEAHALKGSAASFGFLQLAEAAARVEAAARSSDPALTKLAENLLDEAGRVPALLASHEKT